MSDFKKYVRQTFQRRRRDVLGGLSAAYFAVSLVRFRLALPAWAPPSIFLMSTDGTSKLLTACPKM